MPAPATIETAPEPEPPPAPRSRDALERIRKAVKSRMWLLVDVQAIRAHEARDELEAILVWRTPLFTLRELAGAATRLMLTARSGELTPHWAMAAEHELGPAALEGMFERLAGSCDPHPIAGVLHSVRCGLERPYVIAAPTPSLVVVVRTDHAEVVAALTESGGLPEPKAAFEAHVQEPRETFRGRQMPQVPATIDKGYGELRLLPDGGATLLLQGTCASAHQAAQDAAELNRIVDELDIPGPELLKDALKRMLRFEAEGNEVRLQKELSHAQVRFFMLLVDAMSDQEGSDRAH